MRLYELMKDTEGRTVIDRVNKHIEKEADRLLRKFCHELDTRGLTKEAQDAIQDKLDKALTQGNAIQQEVQAVREGVNGLSADVQALRQATLNGVKVLISNLSKKRGVYMTCECTMVTFVEVKDHTEMLWDGGGERGARFLWYCGTCPRLNVGPDDILRHESVSPHFAMRLPNFRLPPLPCRLGTCSYCMAPPHSKK